jgi:hypothetical protein
MQLRNQKSRFSRGNIIFCTQPRKASTGGTKALEPEQEQALILWIDTLAQGFSPPIASRFQGAAEQNV